MEAVLIDLCAHHRVVCLEMFLWHAVRGALIVGDIALDGAQIAKFLLFFLIENLLEGLAVQDAVHADHGRCIRNAAHCLAALGVEHLPGDGRTVGTSDESVVIGDFVVVESGKECAVIQKGHCIPMEEEHSMANVSDRQFGLMF